MLGEAHLSEKWKVPYKFKVSRLPHKDMLMSPGACLEQAPSVLWPSKPQIYLKIGPNLVLFYRATKIALENHYVIFGLWIYVASISRDSNHPCPFFGEKPFTCKSLNSETKIWGELPLCEHFCPKPVHVIWKFSCYQQPNFLTLPHALRKSQKF